MSRFETNPLQLTPSTNLLWAPTILLLGHLVIGDPVYALLEAPETWVDWLQLNLRVDVQDLSSKLVGLLLLAIGGAVFFAMARSKGREPWRVALEAHALRMPPAATALAFVGAAIALLPMVRFAAGVYSAPLVYVWLAGLAMIGGASYLRDRDQSIDLRPTIGKVDVLLIAALVAFGAAVLFYRLGSLPSFIWPDEGAFWVNSRDIADGKWSPRLFEPGTYTFPVLSNYFKAAIITVAGHSLEAWRTTSVAVSLLAVPPMYLLGRHLVGRYLTVGAIVLLLTSPYFIAFARIGYNNMESLAPVAASLYLLYAALERRSALLLFLCACCLGLGFYTYPAARIATIIVALFIVGGVATRWITPRAALITLGGLAVVVLLIALPQNLYLRKTNPDALVYKPVEGLYFDVFYGEFYFPDADLDAGPIGIVSLGTQDQHQMFFDPETHARMIGRGLLRNALAFDDASLINGKHFIPGSLGGPTGSLLLIAGFAAALSARRLRNAQLIAVWAGVCLLLLTVLSSFPPQWTRLVPGLPALALLQSVGLAACLQPFRGAAMRWLRPVVYASIVAVIAVFGLRDYFVNMERDFPPPLLDVIAYAGYTADEPTQIFGVFEEDGRLNERPVLIDEFPTLATYTPVPRATLPAFEGPLLDAANPRVYFDVGSAQETLDLARRLFGDGDVTYYFDADGRAIGGSFVPTER